MPSYVPVYSLPTSQQSFLTREQKRERKRNREADDDNDTKDDDSNVRLENEDDEQRVANPVNRKDQYYVAGWDRDRPLPNANFPHAPVKSPNEDERPIEEQLALLNPPLYVPKITSDESNGSLRRRHLDNLNAILHKCMLKNDWKRASRVFGLILRTELDGNGPDIRKNGLWMIGAELLMRRDQRNEQDRTSPGGEDIGGHSTDGESHIMSDEGFQLARQYYERLVLQYPHKQNHSNSTINAAVIYPALLNIWIYEVQNRSKRARRFIVTGEDTLPELDNESSAPGETPEQQQNLYQVVSRELEEATPIMQRLDDLLTYPEYMGNADVLELRGMVGLWLSDLHKSLAELQTIIDNSTFNDEKSTADGGSLQVSRRELDERKSQDEREAARKIFKKMVAAGMRLSDEYRAVVDENESVDQSTSSA